MLYMYICTDAEKVDKLISRLVDCIGVWFVLHIFCLVKHIHVYRVKETVRPCHISLRNQCQTTNILQKLHIPFSNHPWQGEIPHR